jgi:basic amino acid/polyamine antiporter, APA family
LKFSGTIQQKIGLPTAFSIVVANMIGTGVFTSLGFLVTDIKSVFVLLMLWLAGGIIALSGAMSYSELASAMPRSGGEYHYLSKLFHPFIGFLAGWVSVFVGFAAPTALAAMAMVSYMNTVIPIRHAPFFASLVIVILSAVHSFQIKYGGRFQLSVTLLKVCLILTIIIAGIMVNSHPVQIILPGKNDLSILFSPSFAVSLIFISYSFSGWNAAVYITNEVNNPVRNIPRSLIAGTGLVTLLYILLNFIFLLVTPLQEMQGKIEIGFLAAVHIFGSRGGVVMSMIISLLLISSISSMIWIGPRVSMVMGEDHPVLKILSKKNRYSVPVFAIWTQAAISVTLILTATFEKVLIYTGFTLNIFTLLSVCGVFILKSRQRKDNHSFRSPGFPVTPIIFIALSLWTLTYLVIDKPLESFTGMITILAGSILYIVQKLLKKTNIKH